MKTNQGMSPESILVTYFDFFSDKRKKMTALWKTFDSVGIKVRVEEIDGKWFIVSGKKSVEKAVKFKNDLDKCHPLGSFEWEVAAIERVLKKHKQSKSIISSIKSIVNANSKLIRHPIKLK